VVLAGGDLGDAGFGAVEEGDKSGISLISSLVPMTALLIILTTPSKEHTLSTNSHGVILTRPNLRDLDILYRSNPSRPLHSLLISVILDRYSFIPRSFI